MFCLQGKRIALRIFDSPQMPQASALLFLVLKNLVEVMLTLEKQIGRGWMTKGASLVSVENLFWQGKGKVEAKVKGKLKVKGENGDLVFYK